MLNYSLPCSCSKNLSSFWLTLKQQWTIKISSPFFYFELGGHLGWNSGSPDTILKGGHPRIISAKFGWDWLSSFRGEDFFLISSPLFSNLHNRSISAKVQSS
jgi:hypothetical protein